MPIRKIITVIVVLYFANIAFAASSICARLTKVSAGEDHSLALADDGSLFACGGSYGNYQLGLGGNAYNILSLQQVRGENGIGYLKNIVAFDAGWYHSLAADADGVLWAWGNTTSGQLGGGSAVDYWAEPQRVNGYGDLDENTPIV